MCSFENRKRGDFEDPREGAPSRRRILRACGSRKSTNLRLQGPIAGYKGLSRLKGPRGGGLPPTSKPQKSIFAKFFNCLGAGTPPPASVTRFAPWGSILSSFGKNFVNFRQQFYIFLICLTHFRQTMPKIMSRSEKANVLMKAIVVSLSILCRMHRVSNSGDLILTISSTSQFS